jgi:putative transcriptional regulator
MAKLRTANHIRGLYFGPGEMTQSVLAERIGVMRQTIAAIEASNQGSSLEAAFRTAHVFSVSIEVVFEWDEA